MNWILYKPQQSASQSVSQLLNPILTLGILWLIFRHFRASALWQSDLTFRACEKMDTVLLLERFDFSSKRAVFNNSSLTYYSEWVIGRLSTGDCLKNQLNFESFQWIKLRIMLKKTFNCLNITSRCDFIKRIYCNESIEFDNTFLKSFFLNTLFW